MDSLSSDDYFSLAIYVQDNIQALADYKSQLQSRERLQQLKTANADRETRSHYEKGFKSGLMTGIAAGCAGVALVIYFFKTGRNTR